MEFTDLEKDAINKLVDAWSAFLRLPTEHPSDTEEFRNAIHRAQLLVMARPGRRSFNDSLPNVSKQKVKEIG